MGKPQREVDPYRNELRRLRQALGQRIRELRSARGWSQEEFADRAHIHRTFAGSLERGEKNCSFHALILIARCFDLTLSELLSGLESGQSSNVRAGRRTVARPGSPDRTRLLREAANLEHVAEILKEIATAETPGKKRLKT